jgi:hypothetical protein
MKNISVTVYNVLGIKVLRQTIKPFQINSLNLTNLANGYYFALLESKDKTSTTTIKLIKN